MKKLQLKKIYQFEKHMAMYSPEGCKDRQRGSSLNAWDMIPFFSVVSES
jgi:hypothetical protein